MKIGFIGLGRMGQGMAHLLIKAGHDLAVYDAFPEQAKTLAQAGAKVAESISDVCVDRDVMITMLPSDAILDQVASLPDGLIASMQPDMIHTVMGTHGIDVIRKLTKAHPEAGQKFIAAHVLGRPDLAATGELTIVPGGDRQTIDYLQPLFDVLGKQTFVAGKLPPLSRSLTILCWVAPLKQWENQCLWCANLALNRICF